MAPGKTGEECVMGAKHEAQLVHLEDSDGKQWTAIDLLRNRLPTWATVAISLLTFLVGVLLAFAAKPG